MIKKVMFVLVAILSIDTVSQSAFAYNNDVYTSFRHSRRNNNNGQQQQNRGQQQGRSDDQSYGSDSNYDRGNGNDSQLIDALHGGQRVNFIEGSGMVVVKTLPDDTSGAQHQKWVVRLSNGDTMMAVYNLDMVVNGKQCEYVPLKEGDVVSMGGQYIPTGKNNGLIHWLHMDPRGNRPDGYVELNGKTYCK